MTKPALIRIPSFCILVPLLAVAAPSSAQLAIDWQTIDGGGGASSDGRFTIEGTIGQPDAWVLRGGRFSVTGGYWSLAGAGYAPVATMLVTTVADSGPGSLRQAILEANTNSAPGEVSIHFAIPGTGVQTIAPLTALPIVSRAILIDGYTQAGTRPNSASTVSDAFLRIELSGINLRAPNHGLRLDASGCTVRGLVINGFSAGTVGLSIQNSVGNVIEGNFIGTDVTGLVARSNGTGILVSSGADNRIGGAARESRNVIAGNTIGIDLSVTTSAEVSGNFIGLGADGTTLIPNQSGIYLNNCAQAKIGGPRTGAGNVISGNTSGCTFNHGTSNVIQGNRIGTDATGVLARGNLNGIVLNESSMNLVGGAAAGERNILSGNLQTAVIIQGLTASNNIVMGNLIGTDGTGRIAISNQAHGVLIYGAAGNRFGGLEPGARNVVAFNALAGLTVDLARATNNSARGNRFFANGGLGIDLGSAGPAPNDAGDTDSGANGLQNHPLLSLASNQVSDLLVEGVLSSGPNTSYELDFYVSSPCDPAGHGEGEFWLGSTSVQTDASGQAAFRLNFDSPVPEGSFITATATDSSGNSSEFSPCLAVTGTSRAIQLLPSFEVVAPAVSWPASAVGYVLERTDSLVPPVKWQQVTNGITFDPATGSYTAPISITPGSGFYRLRHP